VQEPAEKVPGRGVSTVEAAGSPGGSEAQTELLERLRAGDTAAFAELVDGWSPVLLRVALLYVSTRASAEEIVQETWLAVITQLDRFQGRSSVKTWVFRILENLGRTRGQRGHAQPAAVFILRRCTASRRAAASSVSGNGSHRATTHPRFPRSTHRSDAHTLDA